MRVEMQAEGSVEDVVRAFTTFGTIVTERGWTVRVENRGEFAQGGGRFEIELPIIDDEQNARAAVPISHRRGSRRRRSVHVRLVRFDGPGGEPNARGAATRPGSPFGQG